MTLSEISIAFNNCNGETNKSFKEHILSQDIQKDSLETGMDLYNTHNYILGDVEKLVDKLILNISSSSLLLKKGYFSWGFITSYYANFYAIQALNRLMIKFSFYATKGAVNCSSKNYSQDLVTLKISNNSRGSHESQFNTYFENYSQLQQLSIDRYFNIGIRPFHLKNESSLRNLINYQIEKNLYYELDLDLNVFNKVIKDNDGYKFDSKKLKVSKPTNYSIYNLELALSRLRVCTYILNYIANDNGEYKNYFINRNKKRLRNLNLKYPNLDVKVKDKLVNWFEFEDIETEQTVTL